MNIIFRELKSHRNGLIFWSIGMAALIGASMAKFAAYQSSGQSMNSIIDKFPKTIQIIFGISGFDLSKASGFYGVVFMYIALMATIHAVLIGTDLISKEERDKTSEFLFTKPISRFKVITAKLIAGLANLVILNLVTLFSSVYFLKVISKASINKDVSVLILGLFFLQLLFFFAGTAIAAFYRKSKAAGSVATSVLLITFILPFLINFDSTLDFLKYLTPFSYFDAKTMTANGRVDPFYMVLSLVIVAILIVLTYLTYTERDLGV